MPDAIESAGGAHSQSEYAPLTMDRYITGMDTMRSPLRDAQVPYVYAKYYSAGRYDSIIDGINCEVSAKLTLARRSGSSAYNTSSFPPIGRFYSFRTVVDGKTKIHVMADTANTVYDATGPTGTSPIFTKSAGSGRTCFQSVGNILYFSDGVENKKWMLSNKAWRATRTFNAGDWIVDSNNNIQLLKPQATAFVSSVEVTSNVATILFAGPSPFRSGANVTLTNLSGAAFLNGVTLTISSSALVNGIQAPFIHADYTATADTGNASSGLSSGITGTTQPVWGSIIGGLTNDGALQWVCWGSSVQNWGIIAPTTSPTVSQIPFPAAYPSWTASVYYSTSFSLIDGNGNVQILTTAGSTGTVEPTWNVTMGGTTTDGTAVWTNNGPEAWAATTDFALGDAIHTTYTYYVTRYIPPRGGGDKPNTPVPDSGDPNDPGNDGGGYITTPVTVSEMFRCVVAGTSGATEPSWADAVALNLTLTDGTVTWQNIGRPLTWATLGASQPLSLSTRIVDKNGYIQNLTTSGKVGTIEPTWMETPGATTIDGSAQWSNGGAYSAAGTDVWRWGYAWKNSIDDTTSTISPVSVTYLLAKGMLPVLQGYTSTDPQADTVVIYRTVMGGSTYIEEDEIAMPSGSQWTYQDTTTDDELSANLELQAARAHSNDPPPVGITSLAYHLGRIWAAVANTVRWCTGPDVTVGNGMAAWSPANEFGYPDTVVRMVPVTLSNGALLTFTVSDMWSVFGSGTGSNPFYTTIYAQGIGLQNPDALDIVGATMHLHTGARKQISLDPSAGYTETGFAIGDQFNTVTTGGIVQQLYDPATVYVTWHEAETADTALYVADGSVGWFRYSPISSPETGFLWSPRAAIEGGTSAVQSIEVLPGVRKLLIGPKTNGPILMRDLNVNSDNGVAYQKTYCTIGNLTIVQPGSVAEIAFVTLDSIRVGTAPTCGLLFGEIAETANVKFDMLVKTSNDPPNLPASETLFNDRFSAIQNGQCPMCRHLQLIIQWSSEDAPSELITHTIFGRKHSERVDQ